MRQIPDTLSKAKNIPPDSIPKNNNKQRNNSVVLNS